MRRGSLNAGASASWHASGFSRSQIRPSSQLPRRMPREPSSHVVSFALKPLGCSVQ